MMLGNYFALSSSNCSQSSASTVSKSLGGRIGIFYIFTDLVTYQDQIMAAYSPEGDFNLHDFHHALDSLPTDNFTPDFNDFEALFCEDLKLEEVIDFVALDSWLSSLSAVKRKVILISSCFVENMCQVTRKAILETTDNHTTLELVFLERKGCLFADINVNVDHIEKQIGDIRNCKFFTCIPDLHVLSDLAKRWFQEIKIEKEEQLQAHFIFKINILGSQNQLSCNLFKYFNTVIDGFVFCKTCRCHGIPLSQMPSHCRVTNDELDTLDIWENSVEIGEQTTLHMPSFYTSKKLQKVSSCINFNVIQRTDLGSLSEGGPPIKDVSKLFVQSPFGSSVFNYKQIGRLSLDNVRDKWQFPFVYVSKAPWKEVSFCTVTHQTLFLTRLHLFSGYEGPHIIQMKGVIIGTTYVVAPSTFPHMDDTDRSKLNNQVFQAVCGVLNSLDQGLVCSSNCNLETLMETSFKCYYILLPSEKGLMVLRRLLASEEFLPIPDASRLIHADENKEIENTVRESLLKIEVNKYDPVKHERGFHQEMNLLVKHSISFRAPRQRVENKQGSWEENWSSDKKMKGWLEIAVERLPDSDSFAGPSSSERDQMDTSLQTTKKLDEKTSSILERLEIPRDIKRKVISSATSSCTIVDLRPTKKPLIPFEPSNTTTVPDTTAVPGPATRQLIRPHFQRAKKDDIAKEQPPS